MSLNFILWAGMPTKSRCLAAVVVPQGRRLASPRKVLVVVGK